MSKAKTGKAKGKAKGKVIAVKSADKSRTVTTMAALISVGAGKQAKTVVSANQLALALGLDNGKRLRGWFRQADVLGNDGKYSHYAIDVASADGQAIVQRACDKFKQEFKAVMLTAVKLAQA